MGRIDLPRIWIDELPPCLMNSIAVFPKLFSFQLGCVFHRWPDLLRAPMDVAAVVLDVLLRDLRICRLRSPHGVGVDFRRAAAVGLGLGRTCPEYADSGRGTMLAAGKMVEMNRILIGSLGSDTRLHSGYSEAQCVFRREICMAQMTEEAWLLR